LVPDPLAGLYAWIIYIIAEMAPRGAIWDNIYVVNDAFLTINILSKAPQSPTGNFNPLKTNKIALKVLPGAL
jgi:hypothetical protein